MPSSTPTRGGTWQWQSGAPIHRLRGSVLGLLSFGAIARVRNCVCRSIHDFFQEQGFLYVHPPIITASDCEGAGQMFRVSTIDPNKPPLAEGKVDPRPLITGEVGLNGVDAAFGALADPEKHAKVLIDPESAAAEPLPTGASRPR